MRAFIIAREMSQNMVILAYKRFSVFSLAFIVVVVCFYFFISQTSETFQFQSYGGASHRATNAFVEKHWYTYLVILSLFWSKNIRKRCLCKCFFVQYRITKFRVPYACTSDSCMQAAISDRERRKKREVQGSFISHYLHKINIERKVYSYNTGLQDKVITVWVIKCVWWSK